MRLNVAGDVIGPPHSVISFLPSPLQSKSGKTSYHTGTVIATRANILRYVSFPFLLPSPRQGGHGCRYPTVTVPHHPSGHAYPSTISYHLLTFPRILWKNVQTVYVIQKGSLLAQSTHTRPEEKKKKVQVDLASPRITQVSIIQVAKRHTSFHVCCRVSCPTAASPFYLAALY